jgi:hypothetical protein
MSIWKILTDNEEAFLTLIWIHGSARKALLLSQLRSGLGDFESVPFT